MSSPRLGVVRESMRTDPLLIQAPLGKTRSRGLTVPGPDFTFGTCNRVKDGGVAKALSSWAVQTRPPECARPPDFVSLNRGAVKLGLVTSKELGRYRAQNRAQGPAPAQNRAQNQAQNRAPRPPAPLVEKRPPSPLADLLAHQYGQRWLDQQLDRNQNQNQNQNRNHRAKKPGPDGETRTRGTNQRQAPPPSKPRPPSRLRPQVAPALDTFREPRPDRF
ncbi:cilia- and flagella-associated protein 77 isoform 1-T1 [Menidia menidia]